MKYMNLLCGTRAVGSRRNGSFGGSGEECVVTSLVPLGIAVALIERGSIKGLSKELNLLGKLPALRNPQLIDAIFQLALIVD